MNNDEIISYANKLLLNENMDLKNREYFIEIFLKLYIECIESNRKYSEDEDPKEVAKQFSFQILNDYEKCLNSGHSVIFSKIFSYNNYIEDDINRAKDMTYRELREKNYNYRFDYTDSNIIYKEAYSEGINLSKNNIYATIYAKAIVDGEESSKAEQKAKIYLEAYQYCISKNYSLNYAEIYAYEISIGSIKSDAEKKAEIYNNEIISGKAHGYALHFADKFTELLIDAYGHGLINDETDIIYYKIKARIFSYLEFEKDIKDKKYHELYERKYLKYFLSEECSDSEFVVNESIEEEVNNLYAKSKNGA